MNKLRRIFFKTLSKPKNKIKFNKYLEYKKVKQRQENFKNYSPNFVLIKKHINTWNLKCSVDEYIIRMEKEPFLKLFHLKNPDKQNISEKTQLRYIQNRGISVYKLPSTGKEAMYICNGELITGTENKKEIEVKKKIQSTKSIDFIRYRDDGVIQYIYAKYTNVCGGAQCNQKNDVIHFINLANELVSKKILEYRNTNKTHFVALLDGEYYDTAVMEELNRYIKFRDYIYICNSESL